MKSATIPIPRWCIFCHQAPQLVGFFVPTKSFAEKVAMPESRVIYGLCLKCQQEKSVEDIEAQILEDYTR
jgi:hypothetical protein